MKSQEYIRQVLQKALNEKRAYNPKYSLRMFAKETGISAAALSSFLSGGRNFSKKMGFKLFTNLSLPPKNFITLEDFFTEDKGSKKISSRSLIQKMQIQSNLYYLIADPDYYSYLCLVETINFVEDDIKNAKQLNISITKLVAVKKKLIALTLITRNDCGRLVATNNTLTSTDNVPNYSLRSRHLKNMDDSKHALSNMDVDKRYFVFETLAFDEEDLPLVQAKINQLTDDLIWLSKKGTNKKHVYEFCSHYFPRTVEIKE